VRILLHLAKVVHVECLIGSQVQTIKLLTLVERTDERIANSVLVSTFTRRSTDHLLSTNVGSESRDTGLSLSLIAEKDGASTLLFDESFLESAAGSGSLSVCHVGRD
jgi:hypothetical protein